MIAHVSIEEDGKGSYRLMVNGHDLGMIADHVEIDMVAGKKAASVNVWIPAKVALNIPADLTIFVDYPDADV
jgi:hypothetical protein